MLTVVMAMEYTCASFIHTFGKFEKGRSDFKENRLRLSVVGGCHGNYFNVMGVM